MISTSIQCSSWQVHENLSTLTTPYCDHCKHGLVFDSKGHPQDVGGGREWFYGNGWWSYKLGWILMDNFVNLWFISASVYGDTQLILSCKYNQESRLVNDKTMEAIMVLKWEGKI